MSQNAKLIIDRIKQKLNIGSDKALCQLLDIKQNTLSTWKKRDTLDFNKIISFCEENNLDLNDVFFNDVLTVDGMEPENAFGFISSSSPNQIAGPECVKIEQIKKVNLVNTNREISFFRIESAEPENKSVPKIAIGQRLQLKKIKEGQELALVLKNKEVIKGKVTRVAEDFSHIRLEPIDFCSTLPLVPLDEIKNAFILIGYLDENQLRNDEQFEADKLNQIVLLEKQIERLKKKFM